MALNVAHIAGRFDTFPTADDASQQLQAAGFVEEDLFIFFVSPQEQHSRTPIDGDTMTDRGAKSAPKGAGRGVVIGIILGACAGIGIFVAFKAALIVTAIGAAIGGVRRLTGRCDVAYPCFKAPFRHLLGQC